MREEPEHDDREGDRRIRESDLPGAPLTPYRPPDPEEEPDKEPEPERDGES